MRCLPFACREWTVFGVIPPAADTALPPTRGAHFCAPPATHRPAHTAPPRRSPLSDRFRPVSQENRAVPPPRLSPGLRLPTAAARRAPSLAGSCPGTGKTEIPARDTVPSPPLPVLGWPDPPGDIGAARPQSSEHAPG